MTGLSLETLVVELARVFEDNPEQVGAELTRIAENVRALRGPVLPMYPAAAEAERDELVLDLLDRAVPEFVAAARMRGAA